MNLGWERSLAHPRHISLGDGDHRADGRRSHAGAGGRAPGRRRRRGDEGVSSVVDIQHRPLRPLEHHAAALGQNIVQHAPGVGHKRPHLLGGRGILVEHLRRVQRRGAE